MVKRERPSTPRIVNDGGELAPNDSISNFESGSEEDIKPIIKRAKSDKGKSAKSGGGGGGNAKNGKQGGGDKKGTKTAWTAEDDSALISILEELIKSHLWPAIRASGDEKLIARSSYGCQYHAKLLLRQGKLSGSSPKK
ncbi:hypothetical protein CI109_107372 [Kwoniella shandongensis]|uniref:Uncharacterized protein n=1 Tax=Kwoniella shandongensis TaxID=1734106 RepID=A0A5M6BVQ0_9TREE|nr:uncharacterized protein CI109_004700 [Kwoniella shandongensis]KAA5526924.1 hypothetical protein CI109_004700 [Kwoniella shandongensis]